MNKQQLMHAVTLNNNIYNNNMHPFTKRQVCVQPISVKDTSESCEAYEFTMLHWPLRT